MNALERFSYWMSRRLGGHVTLGPVTVYGANAMHYAVEVSVPGGYIVARPTTYHHGWRRWYVYKSPDGTPGRRAWGFGPGLREG